MNLNEKSRIDRIGPQLINNLSISPQGRFFVPEIALARNERAFGNFLIFGDF
jgi:hypothetical protein